MSKSNSKIRLGVNIDHVATLRQVRGGTTPYPSLVEMADEAVLGGAEQITIHLREDRRHIQDQDLIDLLRWRKVPINLEMAATAEMFRKAFRLKPDWVCLVPEKREELTTEGGLNAKLISGQIESQIARLQSVGIEVSLFLAPNQVQVRTAARLQVDAIEFHTGHWVLAQGQKQKKLWKQLNEAAKLCDSLGMRVHAGHGLDFETCHQIRKLWQLREVNVGHSLICYSLKDGLRANVRKMKKILNS